MKKQQKSEASKTPEATSAFQGMTASLAFRTKKNAGVKSSSEMGIVVKYKDQIAVFPLPGIQVIGTTSSENSGRKDVIVRITGGRFVKYVTGNAIPE